MLQWCTLALPNLLLPPFMRNSELLFRIHIRLSISSLAMFLLKVIKIIESPFILFMLYIFHFTYLVYFLSYVVVLLLWLQTWRSVAFGIYGFKNFTKNGFLWVIFPSFLSLLSSNSHLYIFSIVYSSLNFQEFFLMDAKLNT